MASVHATPTVTWEERDHVEHTHTETLGRRSSGDRRGRIIDDRRGVPQKKWTRLACFQGDIQGALVGDG